MAKKRKFDASVGITEETRRTLLELKIDARLNSMDALINMLITDYNKGHISGNQAMNGAAAKVNEITSKMEAERPPVSISEYWKTETALIKREGELLKEIQRLHNLRQSNESGLQPDSTT